MASDEHVTYVEPDPQGFVSECDCGWVSDPFVTDEEAVEAGIEHRTDPR